MATRDVILRALQDWRRSGEAPLYLQAALNSHELGLLAEVAARAVEGRTEKLERVAETAGTVSATAFGGTRLEEWQDAVLDLREALAALKPPAPIGTPAEAQACAGRSGLGEVG